MSTPFLQAFTELQKRTPRIALMNSSNSENSLFTNYATYNRNCYLVYGTHYCEDTYYARYCLHVTECIDCLDVERSELCYECVFCEKCYNCNYGAYLIGSTNCDYSFDLTNCTDCFLCVGLQNSSYYLLNKRLTKEEYQTQRAELLATKTPAELLQMMEDLRLTVPQRPWFQKNSENCIGSELRNCRNCYFSYRIKNSEDVIYGGTNCNQVKDSVDIDNIAGAACAEIYNSVGMNGSYNVMCSTIIWSSSNIAYSELIFNSHDCFGCISRNHAEYEILNVKYEKEAYFKRVAEIKDELLKAGQYGKIIQPSTFPYADSTAAEYYPQ